MGWCLGVMNEQRDMGKEGFEGEGERECVCRWVAVSMSGPATTRRRGEGMYSGLGVATNGCTGRKQREPGGQWPAGVWGVGEGATGGGCKTGDTAAVCGSCRIFWDLD